MVTRNDVDGHDRSAVFDALRSFDHRGLSETEFTAGVLGLLDPSIVSRRPDGASTDVAADAVDAIATHFATRRQPVCEFYPGREISTKVEGILEHSFTFYDETHSVGEEIDWEYNPGTQHWGNDLNRFTYLTPMIATYRRNGDRRYARKAVELILDWIAKTDICDGFIPDKSSYVWRSYLNINGHLGEWARALAQLIPEGFVDPDEIMTILKSMHDQLAWLEIVIPEHTNNWVVFGARGMLVASTFVWELRDSARFRRFAWDRLIEQIDRQILPDGVQFELTQHYHYGVAKSYATANLLASKNGRTPPARSVEAVAKMNHYLEQTITPDGLHLSYNDSDADCGAEVIAYLEHEATDEAAGDEPGQKKARQHRSRHPETLRSEAFPYAGVYLIRNRDHYLAFDGGPYGVSHQHEDMLSFWIAAFGRSMIVDPGRYIYDRTSELRAHLLTTRAHNTIVVDGGEQRSSEFPESWKSEQPLPNHWSVEEHRVSVGATYPFGFRTVAGEVVDVIHHRHIVFEPAGFYLIYDLLEGTGAHAFDIQFQFMPGAIELNELRANTQWTDANILVVPLCEVLLTPRVREGELDPPGGWYSIGYHRIEPAPQLVYSGHGELPVEVCTLLLPYREAAPSTESGSTGCDLTESNGVFLVTLDGEEYRFARSELARFGESPSRR